MKKIIIAGILLISLYSNAQEKKNYNPFVAVYAGGCVSNPFQFVAGLQKELKTHWSLVYDVHYWNTRYECYCEDSMYSKGKFQSVTPSIKINYNTGKKRGRGLIAGLGLGFIIAKDRGTEQSYLYDENIKSYVLGQSQPGKWDFAGIAPSFNLGIGFRVFHLPVSLNTGYYFAKTTEGWEPVGGGAGFTVILKKVHDK